MMQPLHGATEFVLVHHADPRLIGKKFKPDMAHLLRTKGGVLLPVKTHSHPHNAIHEWSKREYGDDGILPPHNHVLGGPVIYSAGVGATISWAMMIDTQDDLSFDGRLSIVPSSIQRGSGFSSVQPLGNLALVASTAIRIAVEDDTSRVMMGMFDIAPTQACFTAFDFYFSFPQNFRVRWVSFAQSEH